MDFLPSFSAIGGLTALVLGFGFIIFIHELGHFLVAKSVGIKCTQFAVGMGPAIISFRKGMGIRRGSSEKDYDAAINAYLKERGEEPANTNAETNEKEYSPSQIDRAVAALELGETEYRLSWIPLGGYVKMLGQEDINPAAASNDPRSYNSKPIWARACVISAGVVMNLIFAIITFPIVFSNGIPFNAPVIGEIGQLAPASKPFALEYPNDKNYQGLKTGDVIVQQNDSLIGDMSEARISTALAEQNVPIRTTIKRTNENGDVETLTYMIQPELGAQGMLIMGFSMPVTLTLPQDADPAAWPKAMQDAGVKPGMSIVEVDGKPVKAYREYKRLITSKQGLPVDIVFKDKNSAQTATVKLGADGKGMLYRIDEESPYQQHIIGFKPAAMVKLVVPDSPAQAAGLKVGDVIMKVVNSKWPAANEISTAIQESEGSVEVVVLREWEKHTFDILPDKNRHIGIMPAHNWQVMRSAIKDTPADKLNLPPGSRITKINNKAVTSLGDIQRELVAASQIKENESGFELPLTVEPYKGKEIQAQQLSLTIAESETSELNNLTWATPISPEYFKMHMTIRKGDNFGHSLSMGFDKTVQSLQQVYITLLRVAQGSVHPRNFQGPIGIAHTGTRIAQQGVTYLFFFLALISVNLAVVNFLPIPIVDGGHIVFLIIEKIKGSPVGPRVQTASLFLGLALLGCVFVYVTINDVSRLFGGS